MLYFSPVSSSCLTAASAAFAPSAVAEPIPTASAVGHKHARAAARPLAWAASAHSSTTAAADRTAATAAAARGRVHGALRARRNGVAQFVRDVRFNLVER
jgi:hypothetical protein